MRKSTLKAFIVVCLLGISLSTSAQYILSYCDGSLSHPVGQSVGSETYDLSSAMYLGADKLTPLTGNVISSVKIGLMNGTSSYPVNSYGDLVVFIKKTLDGDAITTQTLAKADIKFDKWNEVTLEHPVTIDGQPLYIGYTIEDANSMPIAFDKNVNMENENATWFAHDGEWEKNPGFGNTCIKAVVTGDNVPAYNVTVTDIVAPSLVKSGERFSLLAYVFNKAQTINSMEIVGKKGEETVFTSIASDLELAFDSNNMVLFDLSCTGVNDKSTLDLYVSKINGEEVNQSEKYSFPLSCSENCVPRKIFLEHFTSLPCSGCPGGLARMKEAIGDDMDKIVWISHHNGAFTDDYTIAESNAFIDFYGVDFCTAPSAMFDRVNWAKAGAMIPTASNMVPSLGPVFTVAYDGATDLMKNILKVRKGEYSPISITDIDQTYSGPGKLVVTVKGEKLQALDGKPAISVFLTEDGLPGNETHGVQDHVARYVANEIKYYYWGDPITFNSDGTFSVSYEITLSGRGWGVSNMNVIAVVSNLDLTDINNNEVYNAEQVKLYDNGTGIDDNIIENSVIVYGANGKIHVEGEYDSVEVYTVDGKLIDNTNLSAGIYIVQVQMKDHMLIRKVQV